ncbi:MAG: phosphotransferase [Bacteroidota bacterium]|nr:phosphotransferase [Bacteroidota bacterium]
MSFFPVSHSNLSAKYLGEYLQNNFDFHGKVKCSIVRSGINDSYLVEDDRNRYIFRVYSLNWRSEEEIREEIRLLNLLKDNRISVSYPIPDFNKNYIHTFDAPEGERFGVMFSYAEGEKLLNYSNELHYKAGKLMAQFHAVTNNLSIHRTTYNAEKLLITSFEQIGKFLSSQTDEWKYLKSLQQLLLQEFQQIKRDRLRFGIVHLDIWSDNFNIDRNGVITIFDFDFCGNGWLCLDIAYYTIQLYNMERYDVAIAGAKLGHFISGYESITTLTDEEKRILPMLGTALNLFYLGTQCYRFENWSNSFLNEAHIKRYINGVVKRYHDIHRLSEE